MAKTKKAKAKERKEEVGCSPKRFYDIERVMIGGVLGGHDLKEAFRGRAYQTLRTPRVDEYDQGFVDED